MGACRREHALGRRCRGRESRGGVRHECEQLRQRIEVDVAAADDGGGEENPIRPASRNRGNSKRAPHQPQRAPLKLHPRPSRSDADDQEPIRSSDHEGNPETRAADRRDLIARLRGGGTGRRMSARPQLSKCHRDGEAARRVDATRLENAGAGFRLRRGRISDGLASAGRRPDRRHAARRSAGTARASAMQTGSR